MLKLNLGSGSQQIEGYINLDVSQGDVIFPLPYKDVDEIRASHVLEHFGICESIDVMFNWVDALKPGGVMKIAVPDFEDIVRRMASDEHSDYECYIMGTQNDPYDYHKSIWSNKKLRIVMEGIGLEALQTWQSEIEDCATYPFSLNLKGTKRA